MLCDSQYCHFFSSPESGGIGGVGRYCDVLRILDHVWTQAPLDQCGQPEDRYCDNSSVCDPAMCPVNISFLVRVEVGGDLKKPTKLPVPQHTLLSLCVLCNFILKILWFEIKGLSKLFYPRLQRTYQSNCFTCSFSYYFDEQLALCTWDIGDIFPNHSLEVYISFFSSMIFYDLLWSSVIFCDLLWSSMIFYDLLWSSAIFKSAQVRQTSQVIEWCDIYFQWNLT